MDFDRSEVEKLVGRESGAIPALDRVSRSDVRHWCELIGDPDPWYAEKIKRGEKTVPPAMLMAWTLDPLWPPRQEARGPHEQAMRILDEAGYTIPVGVELEQEFLRPVGIGDRLSFKVKLEAVSAAEEETKLGPGVRLGLLYTFLDEAGQVVSTQRFTVVRFRTLRPAS